MKSEAKNTDSSGKTVDLRKRVLGILAGTHLMSLGTVDDGGVWVADVIFVHDENMNIYWLSAPDTRHSQAIVKNGKAAGSITMNVKAKEPNLAIQFEGRAERLEGVRFELVAKHWAKRGHRIPDICKAMEVLEGDCWYQLKPTKMELIDEENFGFEKQGVEVKYKL